MTEENEKTVLISSVGADEGQSIPETATIITDDDEEINSFDESDEEFFKRTQPYYLDTISHKELLETVYLSKPPIIEGLLCRGMYIIAGSPKVGKSFLMAQFAYHVSTGKPLWGYEVRQGTVLYLALEDDHMRLQSRLYRMFGTEGNDNLFFSVFALKLGHGLDEQLSGFMTEHPDTALVIIDTLQKVRDNDGSEYSYAGDYQLISRLKDFADAHGICVMTVHHTRKQQADDKFDMISGTNGLLGAADGGFVLHKEKRTDNEAILDVSGRDQQDQRLHLVRNEETLAWELEMVETQLWQEPPEPVLEAVASFLSSCGGKWRGSPTELQQALGMDIKANTLTLKLNVNASRLLREYGISYRNIRKHDGRKIILEKTSSL